MIHYHGTPITPMAALHRIAGRSFCVSHARPDQVGVVHMIGESVMLDNGAYTHWRNGTPKLEWADYYEWCEQWLAYRTTWAAIPDIIDGSSADNDSLVDEWPHGQRGAPVWHMHEPLDRLDRLCAEWQRVCIGSSGKYATPGAQLWHDRMAEAMAVACDADGVPRAWLHMMRGLRFAGSVYPFASADSTNIARNHATLKRDTRAMANEIDARQTPPRWRPSEQQQTLWGNE